jgi:putative oxidoreductase
MDYPIQSLPFKLDRSVHYREVRVELGKRIMSQFVIRRIAMDEAAAAWPLLVLRVVVGVGFIAHGLAKWHSGPARFARLLAQIGTPFPIATAWMVTLLELCGGVALILGALVLLASVPLIGSMLVAMFSVQWRYGYSSVNTIGLTDAGPVFGPPGYEINLLYIACLVVLVVLGPGKLSIDHLLARGRLRWASHSRSSFPI